MRDVEWGWLIRYMHSTGASFFFIVVYLHMFRAMLYGSYKKPRELIWIIGMLIFLVLMAEAFRGLPAALGPDVLLGCPGDHYPVYSARSRGSAMRWSKSFAAITRFRILRLNRFFALHVIALPLAH